MMRGRAVTSMRTVGAGLALLGVLLMSNVAPRASDDSAPSSGAAGQPPPRPLFVGHPNVAWLVATKVEPTPTRHESHIPGLFVVPYRVVFQTKAILPPMTQSTFIIMGEKGEGL